MYVLSRNAEWKDNSQGGLIHCVQLSITGTHIHTYDKLIT